jgi:hypothetical protein
MSVRRACLIVLPTLFAGLALASCGPPPPFQARFAVRGRVADRGALTVRIEPEGGPLDGRRFRAEIEEALSEWQATGCARFLPATEGDPADVTFSWQRAAHGACVPFGADPGVAHTGPVAPGTFVHFDAGRDWERTLSLRQAALHELGHVLGLDHSADEGAVMFPEPKPERARLAPSDLAGIHSLYGGGEPGAGDLEVVGALTLRRVAPRELADWTLFDTDGDGDQEVLVWRTDAAGHGALTVFSFAPGPSLAGTLGPLYGTVGPGLAPGFLVTEAGERLLVLEPEGAPAQARVFDRQGLPQVFAGVIPPRGPRSERLAERRGDLDGDGRPEVVRLHP